MWIESVAKRLRSKNLNNTAEILDRSGIIKDLYKLVRQSKALIPSDALNEFLSIVRILTEEVWNDQRRVSVSIPDKQSIANLSAMNNELEHSSFARTTAGCKNISFYDSQGLNSRRKPLSAHYSFQNNESEVSRAIIKYKLPVSEEVAYMVCNI